MKLTPNIKYINIKLLNLLEYYISLTINHEIIN